MAYELKITADTADELIASVDAFHAAIAGRAPSVAADAGPAGNEEAPRARRRTAAKTTGETENGAASEPASTDRPALVADEGNDASGATQTTGVTEQTSAREAPAAATASPSEPTQDEKDALLAAATKFSQDHGHDALLAALKAVGAERFSAIPFDKYQAFRDAMAKASAGASALS